MPDDENPVIKGVNENQCQNCMPLGGVIALKGIEDAMALVHGSQGCSTYMRLSMVEHFNEPVDIASSSLNEKQTIYGGESNLRKGLDNVIRVYKPKVLGVVTTCLTETMGEDIGRMIETYQKDRNLSDIDIIPISTPSYSASQTEGFWTALREITVYYSKLSESHQGINIIIPQISPADIREIRRILALMEIEYTLIPDISMTLDQPYGGVYRKISPGGTKREDIAKMAGAVATIQFGLTCPDELSPGKYLEEKFGVPLFNLPLPVGLTSMDQFIETLITITGKTVPDILKTERGWLCDAMADSHKYNAEVKPVIFGEPELVYACTSLCIENGACPSVIATGTLSPGLKNHLRELLKDVDEQPVILEGTDFSHIEKMAVQCGGNLALGNSSGKVLTERHDILLVRVGFPIHDRIGGQRILMVGYTGSLTLLDRITNTYLEKKYNTYRQLRKAELFDNGGLSHAET